MTRVIELTVWLALLASAPVLAQGRPQTPPPPPPGVTPQSQGKGGEKAPAPSGTAATQAPRPQPPASQAGTTKSTAPPASPGSASARPSTPPSSSILPAEAAPTEAQLGLPIFPGATFLRSFDAGQGQRYYLFGSTASFAELVLYYRTQLKDKGDLVYDVPPVHMFEVGRFREESMAFPPGVTVKDYTWGGAKGYLVPTPGANTTRYPTVIQFVPVTAANK